MRKGIDPSLSLFRGLNVGEKTSTESGLVGLEESDRNSNMEGCGEVDSKEGATDGRVFVD